MIDFEVAAAPSHRVVKRTARFGFACIAGLLNTPRKERAESYSRKHVLLEYSTHSYPDAGRDPFTPPESSRKPPESRNDAPTVLPPQNGLEETTELEVAMRPKTLVWLATVEEHHQTSAERVRCRPTRAVGVQRKDDPFSEHTDGKGHI